MDGGGGEEARAEGPYEARRIYYHWENMQSLTLASRKEAALLQARAALILGLVS